MKKSLITLTLLMILGVSGCESHPEEEFITAETTTNISKTKYENVWDLLGHKSNECLVFGLVALYAIAWTTSSVAEQARIAYVARLQSKK